eukprot:8060138-Ditylum_brightwellii.AAC.1
MDGKVLGEEQWTWLETQLTSSDANVHIIVSSIQVLTTNPVMESWGHFPRERLRLLRLLDGVKGLVLLSGDVHHGQILEARSSTTTASTIEFAKEKEIHLTRGPLLERYAANEFRSTRNENADDKVENEEEKFYYTGRNFGTIQFDWGNVTANNG